MKVRTEIEEIKEDIKEAAASPNSSQFSYGKYAEELSEEQIEYAAC